MAYIQKNNPFPVTGCGRRRTLMMTDNSVKIYDNSPMNKLRKTTRGKGRHFLPAEQGAGMTAAGRKAYNKETGGNLKAPQPGGGKRKKSYCARSAGRRWKC